MIIQYVAEDGKIFDDEDECMTYERISKIEFHTKDIKFFTDDLENYSLDLDDPCDPYDSCYFMIFKTQEAAKKYSDVLCSYGYTACPEKKGIYYYDDQERMFMDMKEKVDEMKKFIEKYEKILEMIKED